MRILPYRKHKYQVQDKALLNMRGMNAQMHALNKILVHYCASLNNKVSASTNFPEANFITKKVSKKSKQVCI